MSNGRPVNIQEESLVIPNYMDVYDFTPVQYPADDVTAEWQTTHFNFHDIDENVLKLDVLGHDDPTMIRKLQDLSGIDPMIFLWMILMSWLSFREPIFWE